MRTEIFTIGGYGHTMETFFYALERQGIDILVDIRQRRGMRGSKYAFLNSTSLQAELARRHIAYKHLKELAPTPDIRDLQKSRDRNDGINKREREGLSVGFVSAYQTRVLDTADPEELIRRLGTFNRPCFFCVEAAPAACHRSLVAGWLASHPSVTVHHL